MAYQPSSLICGGPFAVISLVSGALAILEELASAAQPFTECEFDSQGRAVVRVLPEEIQRLRKALETTDDRVASLVESLRKDLTGK